MFTILLLWNCCIAPWEPDAEGLGVEGTTRPRQKPNQHSFALSFP